MNETMSDPTKFKKAMLNPKVQKALKEEFGMPEELIQQRMKELDGEVSDEDQRETKE